MLWPSVMLLAKSWGGLDEMGGLAESWGGLDEMGGLAESGGAGIFLCHLLQGYIIVDID